VATPLLAMEERGEKASSVKMTFKDNTEIELRLNGLLGIRGQIGFGSLQLSYPEMEEEKARELTNLAIKNGITLFDTAAAYGHESHSERLLGNILRDKEGVILSTKCGVDFMQNKYTQTPYEISESVKTSLNKLQRPKIDLLYLHRINPNATTEEFEATIRGLKQQVRSGFVSYVGLSEPTNDQLLSAIQIDPEIPISAVQSAYSIFTRRAEVNGVLDTCRNNNILFVSYTSVLRGLADTRLDEISDSDLEGLSSTELREKVFNIFSITPLSQTLGWFSEEYIHNNLKLGKQFIKEAKRLNVTPAQLGLVWLINNKVVPIPGTTNQNHILENIEATKIRLPPEEMRNLSVMFPYGAFKGTPNPQALATFDNDLSLEKP
jgi:aryl-alcohol dehydrogenase-like predicted oxidoreductase